MISENNSEDPYNLQRFVMAQEAVFGLVCAELIRGRKSGHWMWYIFPQFRGLGTSGMSVLYAIGSIAEAQAYLQHPLLGTRLRKCCELLMEIEGLVIEQILDYPDDIKLRSSMTLFIQASKDNALFRRVLKRYFGGEMDRTTLYLLEQELAETPTV
jgi:uncharacterized protein (DUF1810 family)